MKDIRSKLSDISKRRGIYWPAYDIYGGVGGFYDYGPIGALMKKNLIDLWIREFVVKDGLHLIDAPAIGPEMVYRASGHLEKFTDYMVRCEKCGHAFRADELIKDFVDVPESLSPEEIERVIKNEDIVCPDCGGALGHVEEFHLMFSTRIGMDKVGFLRPETAQGIFVNFPTLYRINREKLPLGVAQVGRAYRNEISPRQGMLRQREFNMAEIELFIDPEMKFNEELIDDTVLPLHTADEKDLRISALEAWKSGIAHGYVIYYMTKILHFLNKIGINTENVRFRQHHKEELAHYSSDTWDCEIYISRGWIEVIGISYRGSYDLERHMRYSGMDMRAFRKFSEEKTIKIRKIRPKMEILGPMFKVNAMKIAEALESMEPIDEESIDVLIGDKKFKVPSEAYDVVEEESKVSGEKFIPHVVEPSFGLDRIIYAILEHSYYERPESGYKVLKVKPIIAAIKAGIFPLMAKDNMDVKAKEIMRDLRYEGFNVYYDDSGSIGRRYARADEIGVPYCITVDYQTMEDDTITLRERDSTKQIRVAVKDLPEVLEKLIRNPELFEKIA